MAYYEEEDDEDDVVNMMKIMLSSFHLHNRIDNYDYEYGSD